MDPDTLARMANRIGEFFDAMPDREAARDGVADHLRKFWAPPMRATLVAHRAALGDRLLPIVRDALERIGGEAPRADADARPGAASG